MKFTLIIRSVLPIKAVLHQEFRLDQELLDPEKFQEELHHLEIC